MATRDSVTSTQGGMRSRTLIVLVIGLFFIWGGTTSLNDVLIPKLKGLYALDYAEVMLTQFAFFMAYFFFSLPAGALISRIGYLRGVIVGLVIMVVGAALFWPAAQAGEYWPFLVALFVVAGGITCLQVAANPLITVLGSPEGASSRLTFAQAFNALGTTIWPWIGSELILANTSASVDPARLEGSALAAFRVAESNMVSDVYIGIALVLLVVAAVMWPQRNAIRNERPDSVGLGAALALLRRRRVALGVIALFAYVGAEVAIGSMLVNYLQLPATLGLDAASAGKLLSVYWGGAMVGRFIGAGLLKKIAPGRLLLVFALANVALIALSMATGGVVSGGALIAVGLFNSIMFPTIFALGIEGLGTKTAEGSSLLCMAIVGGAIVPLLTGHLADLTTLATSLAIPLLCYLIIGAFAVLAPSQEK